MKIIACTKHLKEKFNNKRLSSVIKLVFLRLQKYIWLYKIVSKTLAISNNNTKEKKKNQIYVQYKSYLFYIFFPNFEKSMAH